MNNNYDASSIKIKTDTEFPWEKHAALELKYKGVASAAIKRLIEAQMIAGDDWDIVERRYLQNDKSVSVSETFRNVYIELADQRFSANNLMGTNRYGK